MDQPPFDRSPLDGYALHSADTAGASRETPVTLPVVMKLYAGDAPASPLPAGCAARIMTGAPLPEGADCVLMQELTDGGEDAVRLYAALKPENVVFRGGDIAVGTVIAGAGTVLTPAHLGVLAGQGYAAVPVCKALTVGVLATGSELLAPGEVWTPGKIHDANGIQNAARLRQLGFGVRRRHCSDDPEEMRRPDAGAADRSGCCVITSGGVSVGEGLSAHCAGSAGRGAFFCGGGPEARQPHDGGTVGGKLVFWPVRQLLCRRCDAGAVRRSGSAAGRRAVGRGLHSSRTTCRLTTGFSKSSKVTRFLRARALGGRVEIPGEGSAEAHSPRQSIGHDGLQLPGGAACGQRPVAPGEEVEVLNFVQ